MKRKGKAKAKECPALQLDPARWPAFSTEDWPELNPLQGLIIGPEDWPSLNDEDPAQEDLQPQQYSRRLSGLKGEHEHRKNNPQPAAAFYYDYHKKG